MEFLFVPLVFGVIIAVLVAVAASSRRYEGQWRAAAERLQLDFRPGGLLSRPKISGTRGDLTVTVDVSSSSSGSTSSVRTRYRIGFPPLGLNLRMSRQTGLARAAAFFGVSDVTTGDAAFDEAFSIATSDPQRLSVQLTPDARRLLMELVEDFPSLRVSDDEVRYEKTGIDRETEAVVSTTKRLIDAARALQGSAPAGPTAAPAFPIREPLPPPSIPVMGPDPFTPPRVDLFPAPPPPAAEQQRPASPSAMPNRSEVTAHTIATDLFARRGLSFQITRLFDDKYRGARVVWDGEVRDVRTGIASGAPDRVTILVATVDHELFGPVEVEAVVALTGRNMPAEESQVTVSGTLEGIDPLTRQVTIGDARLA